MHELVGQQLPDEAVHQPTEAQGAVVEVGPREVRELFENELDKEDRDIDCEQDHRKGLSGAKRRAAHVRPVF